MSWKAVAWAFDQQDVKGTAKLVLVALCERADKHTWHCFPSMKQIAEDASCSERAAHIYVAALKRNGFVASQNIRGTDGRQRANNYWILADRPAAKWISGPLTKEQHPDKEDDEATIDSGPTAENAVGKNASDLPKDSGGPTATVCRQEPSESEPSESLRTEESERRSVAMRPAQHDPTARKQDQARFKAAEQARKPKMVPVIEGTRAWAAWLQHGHKPGLVSTIIVNGQPKRGWYFPSLFPPNATGPPIEGAEFADEFEDETAE